MTDDKTQEVTETTEEVKEEVVEVVEKKEEAKPVEETKVEKTEEKPAPSGKFKDLIKEIEGLTALELSELVKELEDRFGVSAAAPMAMMAGGAAPAAGAEEEDEKSSYTVVLKDGGSNKIGAIKAVREILPELGLVEAKTLVESAPKTIKEGVSAEDAKVMKEKLEAAGTTVELQ